MRSSLLLAALVATVASSAACTLSNEDPTTTEDAELRTLKDTEIVGDIALGETKSVTYVPPYIALSYSAVSGDKLEVSVSDTAGGAPSTDVFVYLTHREGDVLVGPTLGALTYEVKETGPIFVVLRHRALAGGTFHVTLGGSHAPAPTFQLPDWARSREYLDVPLTCTTNGVVFAAPIRFRLEAPSPLTKRVPMYMVWDSFDDEGILEVKHGWNLLTSNDAVKAPVWLYQNPDSWNQSGSTVQVTDETPTRLALADNRIPKNSETSDGTLQGLSESSVAITPTGDLAFTFTAKGFRIGAPAPGYNGHDHDFGFEVSCTGEATP